MANKTVTVPDIGGATDVVVIEVLVKAGDSIHIDTPVMTLESDKATMEVPSSDEGVVKEIKIKVGDTVSQGSPILVLETAHAIKENNTAISQADQPENAPVESEIVAPTPEHTTSSPQSGTVMPAGHHADVHAGPAVRKLARELGVNLSDVTASGPKQRILKEDIQAYVKLRLSLPQTTQTNTGLPAAPVMDFAKFGPVSLQPLSRIKKVSGKNLHRNWLLVPHVTQFGEADITALDDFRQAQKGEFEKQGIKLTPLVFIMKATVAALKAFPQFNASLDPAGDTLIMKQYFHVGVAVDTPDGLVVPVIRDVDKKGLMELAKELNAVSDKARLKQLTVNDMQGGCFSISSLGGIGGTAFTPIVNLPEVAILGVSKSSYKPVYEKGGFVPRLMLPLSLSYDHRVIDGADGARFIVYLSHLLSDIRNLLL